MGDSPFEQTLLPDPDEDRYAALKLTEQAGFRDPKKTLDNFDFNFNKKMNRSSRAAAQA